MISLMILFRFSLMPLLTVSTSIEINKKNLFLKNFSYLISKLTNKSEQYVMVRLLDQIPTYFDGDESPSCFIDLKSIGSLNPSLMSKEISVFVSDQIGIPISRIYINFEDIDASNWSWNGKTFG